MKLIKWELRVFVWLVGFLLFLFIIMEFPDYNFKRKDKGLHIPFTSYDIENEKESTIQMILEDCGFENIVVDYVQTDSADKNGYIKSFTVGTSNSFTVDECYPENVPIKIIAYKLSED